MPQMHLNAKLLFDDNGLENKQDKEDYSEVFYKYLRQQSYIDYEVDNLINIFVLIDKNW